MPTDLKAFQDRLNSDAAFRSAFLKDPVKKLEAAGLVLPAKAKKELRKLVAQLATREPTVPGATLEKVEISMRIVPPHSSD